MLQIARFMGCLYVFSQIFGGLLEYRNAVFSASHQEFHPGDAREFGGCAAGYSAGIEHGTVGKRTTNGLNDFNDFNDFKDFNAINAFSGLSDGGQSK